MPMSYLLKSKLHTGEHQIQLITLNVIVGLQKQLFQILSAGQKTFIKYKTAAPPHSSQAWIKQPKQLVMNNTLPLDVRFNKKLSY